MSKELIVIPGGGELSLVGFDERVVKNLSDFARDMPAFAKTTLKSMQSVLRQWSRWCEEMGYPYLPIQPEACRAYLIGMHEDGKSVATVRQHYSMLAKIHNHAGLEDLTKNQTVSLAMRRITRTAVQQGERTGQAVPFRLTDLKVIAQVLDYYRVLADARDLAFLGVAYNTMLRIAEIGRIRLRDIQEGPENRIVLRIAYTKTVLTTDGQIRTLSQDSSAWLRNWIDKAGHTDPDAYVFSGVDRWGKPRKQNAPLSNTTMESIFARAWFAVRGLPGTKDEKGRYAVWSGHSARVGAAQDMAAKGIDPLIIMKQGGWKRLDMVMRYIRNLEDADNDFIKMIEQS